MSIATVEQIGQKFAVWLAAVQRGETVAIVDSGREIARLTPSLEKNPSKTVNPWANRMAELEALFPEPVLGASEVLEEIRADCHLM
jgi:antitoxin (DNA-binding transcriptional repressor) of toxin-antitoxin stability system